MADYRRAQLRDAFICSTPMKYRNIPNLFDSSSHPISFKQTIKGKKSTSNQSHLQRLESITSASRWDNKFSEIIVEASMNPNNPDWTERKLLSSPLKRRSIHSSQDTYTSMSIRRASISSNSPSLIQSSSNLRRNSSLMIASNASSPTDIDVEEKHSYSPLRKSKSTHFIPTNMKKNYESVVNSKSKSCPNSPLGHKFSTLLIHKTNQSIKSDNSSIKSKSSRLGVSSVIQNFDTRLKDIVVHHGNIGSNQTLNEEFQVKKKLSWRKHIHHTDEWRDAKEGFTLSK